MTTVNSELMSAAGAESLTMKCNRLNRSSLDDATKSQLTLQNADCMQAMYGFRNISNCGGSTLGSVAKQAILFFRRPTFGGTRVSQAILLNPLKRLPSDYGWNNPRIGAPALISNEFVAFLKSRCAQRRGLDNIEYFCGRPKETPSDRAEAIAAAADNLSKFVVVGTVENAPRFERKVHGFLGPRMRSGHQKATSRRSGEDARGLQDPALMARIEKFCRPNGADWKALCATAEGSR